MSADNVFHEDLQLSSHKEDGLPRGDKTIEAVGEEASSGPPNVVQDLPMDEGLLDQLVDGELSEQQKRQVLQQLQSHPDGWRRLALAFLEAQAWREEIPRLVGQMRLRDTCSETQHQKPGRLPVRPGFHYRFASLVGRIVTLAGVILLAFLGGYLWRDVPLISTIQKNTLGQSSSPPEIVQAQKKSAFSPEWEGKKHPETPERFGSFGWEYVTLMGGVGPDGVPEVVRVPVSPVGSPIRIAPALPPIPEEVLHLLRRWGAEISYSRQFVPLRIEDGSQVVVPVEQVELYHRPQGERFQ